MRTFDEAEKRRGFVTIIPPLKAGPMTSEEEEERDGGAGDPGAYSCACGFDYECRDCWRGGTV